MMNFWFDQSTTLNSLKSLNSLDDVFKFILNNIDAMKKDFEIKRLIIGISSLLMTPGLLDNGVQNYAQQLMHAILFLCERSINLKIKSIENDKE